MNATLVLDKMFVSFVKSLACRVAPWEVNNLFAKLFTFDIKPGLVTMVIMVAGLAMTKDMRGCRADTAL